MRAYLELAKPRISVFVGLSTWIGYVLAGGAAGPKLAFAVAGATLASGACGALNQWLERDADARMIRTRRRPLPSGRLTPRAAFLFGALLGAVGLAVLALGAGLLPAAWTLLTMVLYLGLYTPMKRTTRHSTWVGAAAGAIPPLVGWSAAAGTLAAPACFLFALQFLWQIPHFLALFWLYREDYARAGFRVAPVVDPSGATTACQIAVHSFSILPVSLLPLLTGTAGVGYGVGALVLGAGLFGLGARASWTLEASDARRLFRGTLLYLPAVFGMLVFAGGMG